MDNMNQMYVDSQLPPVLSKEEEFELGKKLKSKNKQKLTMEDQNLGNLTK